MQCNVSCRVERLRGETRRGEARISVSDGLLLFAELHRFPPTQKRNEKHSRGKLDNSIEAQEPITREKYGSFFPSLPVLGTSPSPEVSGDCVCVCVCVCEQTSGNVRSSPIRFMEAGARRLPASPGNLTTA